MLHVTMHNLSEFSYSVNTSDAYYLTQNSNYSIHPQTAESSEQSPYRNWGVLSLILVIIATALGNILVCLAVCWEKRLQNMTNYFLMSLAIADLLVSLLVMPVGMIIEIYGEFIYYNSTDNPCYLNRSEVLSIKTSSNLFLKIDYCDLKQTLVISQVFCIIVVCWS